MSCKLIELPHNTGFASGGVTCKLEALCFYSSSMQVDSFVLRNPPERKAANRYWQPVATEMNNIIETTRTHFVTY